MGSHLANRTAAAEVSPLDEANLVAASVADFVSVEEERITEASLLHHTSLAAASPGKSLQAKLQSPSNADSNLVIAARKDSHSNSTSDSTENLSPAQSNESRAFQELDVSHSATISMQHSFLDAAKGGDNHRVQALALRSRDLINCQPAHRWTALHFAAFQGNASLVEFLLSQGASLESRGRDGATPLDVAQPEVFELLLAAVVPHNVDSNAGQKDVRASKEVINDLPLRSFAEGGAECQECHICLEEFVKEDQVRDLPCGHCFHAACIDDWLADKSGSCPVCRASVVNF